MKELSIEQKAKAYDEVMGRAKKELDACGSQDCDAARQIFRLFPELKESEDERIRGKIIATIHLYYGEPLEDEAKEMIAWLEKQGEQKPAFEMITPEESLGIDSDTYNKIVDDCVYGEQKPVDADLKDIVDKEANAIWKEINTGGSHSIVDSFNQFYGICMQVAEAVVDCKKPIEWIQELESKLSNATPEQLAEWKEKYFKVEPAWSEEDVAMLDSTIAFVEHSAFTTIGKGKGGVVSWLKSLKERYTWKPSEEQMQALEYFIINHNEHTGYAKDLEELRQNLKKLTE